MYLKKKEAEKENDRKHHLHIKRKVEMKEEIYLDCIIIHEVMSASCRSSFKLPSIPTKQQANLKFPDAE